MMAWLAADGAFSNMKSPNPFTVRVAAVIRKHQMLETGDRVLVGVSGGPDSVSLVRVLAELGFSMGLAHVNHALRGRDSELDAQFVEALARELDLPYFYHHAPIDPGPGNLEAAARKARQSFLHQVLDDHGFSKIGVAHSLDDRAETFLLHLTRGSGSEGLTSMRPVAGRVVRPLIETTRAQINAYLERIGQTWRSDLSNLDTRFARNRMRHVVIPELETLNPRLGESLARTVGILASESDWMDQAAQEWLPTRISRHGAILVMNISDLRSEPVAMVRRVLRCALRMAGSGLEDVGYDHIEQIRSLLKSGKSGRMVELPGRIQVERSFETLQFRPSSRAAPSYEYALPIPGRVHIPEIGADFEARLVTPGTLKPNGHKALVDGESLGAYVKIRNWKSGDCYNPAGLRTSKLKTLFQKERISMRSRRRWPVVVARSSIVWVATFPVSRDFVPTGSSQRIVELEASLSPEMI